MDMGVRGTKGIYSTRYFPVSYFMLELFISKDNYRYLRYAILQDQKCDPASTDPPGP